MMAHLSQALAKRDLCLLIQEAFFRLARYLNE